MMQTKKIRRTLHQYCPILMFYNPWDPPNRSLGCLKPVWERFGVLKLKCVVRLTVSKKEKISRRLHLKEEEGRVQFQVISKRIPNECCQPKLRCPSAEKQQEKIQKNFKICCFNKSDWEIWTLGLGHRLRKEQRKLGQILVSDLPQIWADVFDIFRVMFWKCLRLEIYISDIWNYW